MITAASAGKRRWAVKDDEGMFSSYFIFLLKVTFLFCQA